MFYNGLIKQVPKDFEYPREGENVVKLSMHCDISLNNFQLAWQRMVEECGKVVWPKNIVMAAIPISLIQALAPCLKGDFLVGNNNYMDEWWITFEGTDKVFYSSGA